ncbi:hypothetical protein NQZ68_031869 [Dissostichus eleginoides]|nr:hypothetical protein NQZ68_031869 [Dissostichus eleginoides]
MYHIAAFTAPRTNAVTLDLHSNQQKFGRFLRSALDVLSQLRDCVEEILSYLKSCFSREPTMATVCVQQVVAWRLLQNQLPLSVDLQWALSCLCLALQQPCVWNKLSTAEYA